MHILVFFQQTFNQHSKNTHALSLLLSEHKIPVGVEIFFGKTKRKTYMSYLCVQKQLRCHLTKKQGKYTLHFLREKKMTGMRRPKAAYKILCDSTDTIEKTSSTESQFEIYTSAHSEVENYYRSFKETLLMGSTTMNSFICYEHNLSFVHECVCAYEGSQFWLI